MENSQIKITIKKMEELAKQKDFDKFSEFSQKIVNAILLADDINYSSKRELVRVFNNISIFFGDFKGNEFILKKLLTSEKNKLKPNEAYIGFIMNLLGELHYYKGQYNSALDFYQKALEIRLSFYDDSHPDTIESYTNLALLYTELGQFSEAEAIFNRSLNVYESIISGHIEDYIKTLWNTGLMYQYWGKYSLAMEKYLTALEISQLNATSELTDTIENNLGVLYLETGNYMAAEEYLQRSVRYTQKFYGKSHPKSIITLNNLVSAQMNLGKLEKAEKGFSNLLEIQTNHIPIISLKININYGVFLMKKGKTEKALKLLEECLDQQSTPEIQIKILSNISKLYLINKEVQKAHEMIKKAIAHQEEKIGQKHIQYTKLLGLLAQTYIHLNKKAQAFQILKEATELQNEILLEVSTSFSKDYAWNFLQKISGEMDQLISLFSVFQMGNKKINSDNSEYMTDLFGVLLRRKAVVFDASIERFCQILKRSDPYLQELFETLLKTKEEIVLRTTKGYFNETPEENKKRIKELYSKAEIMENKISNLVPVYTLELKNKQATLQFLKSKIPENSLFIDIFKFCFFDFFFEGKQDQKDSYIIFYISKNKTNCLILENSHEIDRLINQADPNNDELNRGFVSKPKQDGPKQVSEVALRKLWNLLFDNQEIFRKNKYTTLLVSPDGSFFNLPFESLICTNGHFLIENYCVQYVNSGRQLMFETTKLRKREKNNNTIRIFTDPSFDLNHGVIAHTKKDASHLKRMLFRSELSQFPRLPGTASEANEILQVLNKKNIESVSVSSGELVNDGEIKRMDSPQILHFATHGFYLENRVDIHPFSRCGIALSGINNILRGEDIPSLFEDGMLTGMDILSLNLIDTDIVVLSACKTGKGQIKAGEGVMGLCSALISAGVSSVMVSLWNVPDTFTVPLMSSFYENLVSGMKKSEALQASKQSLINSLRVQWGEAPPWIWGGFILYGDDSPIIDNSTNKALN